MLQKERMKISRPLEPALCTALQTNADLTLLSHYIPSRSIVQHVLSSTSLAQRLVQLCCQTASSSSSILASAAAASGTLPSHLSICTACIISGHTSACRGCGVLALTKLSHARNGIK